MSARQFQAWEDYRHCQAIEELNQPSRTDHYLMQIAWMLEAIQSAKAKRRFDRPLSAYRLKFGKEQSDPATKSAMAKAAVLARSRGTVREFDADGNLVKVHHRAKKKEGE